MESERGQVCFGHGLHVISITSSSAVYCRMSVKYKLATVSIAEPLQNRQHAQNP